MSDNEITVKKKTIYQILRPGMALLLPDMCIIPLLPISALYF